MADAFGGDGDDAAVLDVGDGHVVLAAEAIWPPFVEASPRAAGVAGIVTCLNDLAACGARPLAVLDTVVADADALAREVLDGLRAGAALYRVPVLGGHMTVEAGAGAGLSTFAVGRALRPLRAADASPGDTLSFLTCLQGEMVGGMGQASFFSHLRGARRDRAAQDLAFLPSAAEDGVAWAARDVSMPGLAGSLVQMCEAAGGLGCALDLDAIPVPPDVTLGRWLVTFPSYGFLVAGEPGPLTTRAAASGLTCVPVGTLDGSGTVRLRSGTDEAVVWDLGAEPLTGLSAAP